MFASRTLHACKDSKTLDSCVHRKCVSVCVRGEGGCYTSATAPASKGAAALRIEQITHVEAAEKSTQPKTCTDG